MSIIFSTNDADLHRREFIRNNRRNKLDPAKYFHSEKSDVISVFQNRAFSFVFYIQNHWGTAQSFNKLKDCTNSTYTPLRLRR